MANVPRVATTFTNWINVVDYGAKGDGKIAYNASISSGALSTLNLSSVSTTNPQVFAPEDVGKPIWIAHATSPLIDVNNAFTTTIATFVNPTQVTLTAAAPSGLAGTGIWTMWGTDDTAAIQAAVVDARGTDAYGAGVGLLFDNHGGRGAVYCLTDTIDFGAFSSAIIRAEAGEGVNGDIAGDGFAYQTVSLRWLGSLEASKSVSSITLSGSIATVTTTAAHNLSTGMFITVTGATSGTYNGTFPITVTGSTTFTYAVRYLETAASPAAGTITVIRERPVFFFRDESGALRIENLGFYGGDKALLFRAIGPFASGQGASLNKVMVRNCEFEAQRSAAIFIGRDFGDIADNDMGLYTVTRCTFDPACGNGVQANIAANGYGLNINDSNFYNLMQLGARPILIKNWNHIAIRDVMAAVGDSDYNSEYMIEVQGGVGGALNIDGVYTEGQLAIKANTANSVVMGGATIQNVYVNTSAVTLSATPAIDITGTAVFINVGVSSFKAGTPQARKIRTSGGSVAIGATPPQTDQYLGQVVLLGPITGSTGYQMSISNNTNLDATRVTTTGSAHLIGLDTLDRVLVAGSGDPVVTGAGKWTMGGALDVAGGVTIYGVTPTAPSGAISLGTTTATSATSGSASTLPGTPAGYLVLNRAGSTIKIPYYNA
jgi:hypothetical protein